MFVVWLVELLVRKVCSSPSTARWAVSILGLEGINDVDTKGERKDNKIHQVGHYYYEIVTSPMGETLSEKSFNRVIYNK